MGVLMIERRPILSALVLFVASFGSFVWGFGWYFLLAIPLPFGMVALGSLPYFVVMALVLAMATTELVGEALTEPPRREAG